MVVVWFAKKQDVFLSLFVVPVKILKGRQWGVNPMERIVHQMLRLYPRLWL